MTSISYLMNSSGVAFGTSGARGLVSNMTNEVCFAYTLGFLQCLDNDEQKTNVKKVAIGGDLRESTPRIMQACMAAAKSLGFECDYQGFLPSPALALYGIKNSIPSIMVTGSHIPDNRNGIKFCNRYGEITKKDEENIRLQNVSIPERIEIEALPSSNGNALKMYKEYITGLFPKNSLQNINIAFYQHSAVGRDIALEILRELGAEVKPFGRSEKFIPVDTEAIRKEDYELAAQVCSGGDFFCAVSTDGDSDRPLLSDEKGLWFRGDSLGILAAKALNIEALAIPVSCNTAAEKSNLFKKVLRTKIGSPFVIEGIKELQKEYKRVAGFEANGGFLTESLATRDALTPVIATIIESKKQNLKLSKLLATLPQRYTASGLVKEFPPALATKKLEELQRKGGSFFKPASVNTIDGYRMEFENKDIIHLRKSGNAPEFRCYTESDTIENAEQLSLKCTKILESWKIMNSLVSEQETQTITSMNYEMLCENPNLKKFEELGNSILESGNLAAFLLAGGQGSRLGFDGPKGVFNLKEINKTIFQIHAEKLLQAKNKYKKDIPWVIMTSPLNNKETIEHFEQNAYFGLNKSKIKFIEQNTVCALTSEGEVIFDDDNNLALVPDGNGGCFRAISSSGALAWLKNAGIKFVFLYGVDNILASPCDSAFVGAFANSQMACASKVVKKKSPNEKMGVFALKNGLPTVIEYTEIPKGRETEFDAGNIVAHLFTIDSLTKLETFPLPWHLAIKRICNIDGAYKFEQFLFDAFPKLETMFLAGVEREKEFAPIKNASGEDSPESAIKLFKNALSIAFSFVSLLFFLIFSGNTPSFAQDYPTYNVTRPYTLRYLDYSPLLYRYHEITAGNSPQSFYYPQMNPNFREQNNTSKHGKNSLLYWYAEDKSAMISISPIAAFDMRGGKALGDTIQGYEGGLFIRGYKDSLDFWLDARMFVEGHSADPPQSWDREFLENQGDKGIDDEVKYSSYSRYRGNLNIRMSFGNLTFARDAAHWGPGYFNNLTLNQNSVPFNQMNFSTKIGPLTVISLYGDLRIASNSMSTANLKSRNLYGHRYELNFANTQIGISELTVLYDLNKPWLFIPIVPLFIEKGNFTENNNNGTLSIDVSQRLPYGFRVYSEFLLDDMESPTSLIRNDNIEAKWAFTGGLAYAGDFGNFKAGSVAEYARVEPYVYSHFHPSTAQVEHLGQPLGAPKGPNSQTINWLLYAKHKKAFQFQIGQEWAWKGSDYGSAINDTTPTSGHYSKEKHFLRDENGKRVKMKYSLKPAISYTASRFAISSEYSFFNDNAFCSRIMVLW